MPRGLIRYEHMENFHLLTFSWQAATISVTNPNPAVGAPGPSQVGTGEHKISAGKILLPQNADVAGRDCGFTQDSQTVL